MKRISRRSTRDKEQAGDKPVFLYGGNMDNEKEMIRLSEEINRLCEELKWDPIYPCSRCPRKDEEFCSNRKCLETLQKEKEKTEW